MTDTLATAMLEMVEEQFHIAALAFIQSRNPAARENAELRDQRLQEGFLALERAKELLPGTVLVSYEEGKDCFFVTHESEAVMLRVSVPREEHPTLVKVLASILAFLKDVKRE